MVQEHRTLIAREGADVPAGTLLDETLRVTRLGIGWEPVRRAQIGFGVDRGLRESNTLGRNYNYTAFMLNGRLIF